MSTNSSRTLHDEETLSMKNIEVIGSPTPSLHQVRSNSVTSMRRSVQSIYSVSGGFNSSIKPSSRLKRVSNGGPMGRGLVSSKSFIASPGVRPIELESIRAKKKQRKGFCSIPLTVTCLSVSLVFLTTLIVWVVCLGVHFQLSANSTNSYMSSQNVQTGRALQYVVNSLSRDLEDLISQLKIHSISQSLSSYSQVELIRNLFLQKNIVLGHEIGGIFISYDSSNDLIATKTLSSSTIKFQTIIQSLSDKEKLSQEIGIADAKNYLIEKKLTSLPSVNTSLSSLIVTKPILAQLCSESTLEMKIISPTTIIEPVISSNIGAISKRLYNSNNESYGCIGYILSEDYIRTLLTSDPQYGFVLVKNNNPLITTTSPNSYKIDSSFISTFTGSVVRVDLASSSLVSSGFSLQSTVYDGYWNLIMVKSYEDNSSTGFMAILVILVPIGTIVAAITSLMIVDRCFMRTIRQLTDSFRDVRTLKLNSDGVNQSMAIKSSYKEIADLAENFRGIHCNITSFTKYVPTCVSQELMTNRKTAVLGLEDILCVVSFLDIKNFTSYSEKLTPNQLVRVMSDAFEGLTSLVLDGGGILDKYIGDCVSKYYYIQWIIYIYKCL